MLIKDYFHSQIEGESETKQLVIQCLNNEEINNNASITVLNNSNYLKFELNEYEGNNEFRFYIQNKLSLSEFLSNKKINRIEAIKILHQISRIVLESKKTQLLEMNFVLECEYIYINEDSQEISLIYIPIDGKNVELNVELKKFIRDFLSILSLDEENENTFKSKVFEVTRNSKFCMELLYTFLKEEWYEFRNKPIKVETENKQENIDQKKEPIINQINVEINEQRYYIQNEKPLNVIYKDDNAFENKNVLSNNNQLNNNVENYFQDKVNIDNNYDINNRKYKDNYDNENIEVEKDNKIIDFESLIIAISIQLVIFAAFWITTKANMFTLFGEESVLNIIVLSIITIAFSFFLWNIALKKNPKKEDNNNRQFDNKNNNQQINISKVEMRSNTNTYNIPYDVMMKNGNFKDDPQKNNQIESKYPFLELQNGDVIERISITKPNFKIGRLRGSVDYVTSNITVGKVHAEILFKNGSYYIRDLNSRNGTFLNNKRLIANIEFEIKNGDRVSLASTQYIFNNYI